MAILISNEIIKYEKHELCHDTTHGHLSRTSWLHTLKDVFRELYYHCWLQPLGTAGFSAARRTKLSDCCFGKLNDLKQTQPDCAAILGNAMTLTALLPAKLCSSVLWWSKSLLILKITYLKAQLILLAVPLKVQAAEGGFSVPRGISNLGYARWMPFMYTSVYFMLYWTGKALGCFSHSSHPNL